MEILRSKFEGMEVRQTPDGKVSVLDALKAVGIKDAPKAWKRVQGDNPEFMELAPLIQTGRGRPSPFATEEAMYQILMTISTRYLDDHGRQIVLNFRAWLGNLATRYRHADATLAAEIIDRQTDPRKVEWLARRVENKGAALALNACIHEHGGTPYGYRKTHDLLNVAVTGMKAQSIRKRGSRVTKDNLSVPELTLSTMSQIATASGIEQRAAQGDAEIIAVADEVSKDIAAFRRKWLGARPFPSDGNGLLTVSI